RHHVLPYLTPLQYPPSHPTRRSSDLTSRAAARLRRLRRDGGGRVRTDRGGGGGALACRRGAPASGGLARHRRYRRRGGRGLGAPDRKSTRLNSSHQIISYAVFCVQKI